MTHDDVSYTEARYLPDGKQLLVTGIEKGHGAREYLMDVITGSAKPITSEGFVGNSLSPDGHNTVVLGPDGNWGVWPLDGSGLRPIPGLDSRYYVFGWTPDESSLYVVDSRDRSRAKKVYRANVSTGKLDYWRSFGDNLPTGAEAGVPILVSADGSAYVYLYDQVLSQAYVVKGLK